MVELETGLPFEPANEDILQDPEERKSRLPQPYRRLDKLVWRIFENAWEIINEGIKREERISKRCRTRQLVCHYEFETPYYEELIGACHAYKNLLFIGLCNGLAVYKTSKKLEKLASFCRIANVKDVAVQKIKNSCVHVLVCVATKKGWCYVMTWHQNRMILLAIIKKDPQQQEEETKNTKCFLSSSGQYVALLEKISCRMDVYWLPLEVWCQRLTKVPCSEEDKVQEETNELNFIKDMSFEEVSFCFSIDVKAAIRSEPQGDKLINQKRFSRVLDSHNDKLAYMKNFQKTCQYPPYNFCLGFEPSPSCCHPNIYIINARLILCNKYNNNVYVYDLNNNHNSNNKSNNKGNNKNNNNACNVGYIKSHKNNDDDVVIKESNNNNDNNNTVTEEEVKGTSDEDDDYSEFKKDETDNNKNINNNDVNKSENNKRKIDKMDNKAKNSNKTKQKATLQQTNKQADIMWPTSRPIRHVELFQQKLLFVAKDNNNVVAYDVINNLTLAIYHVCDGSNIVQIELVNNNNNKNNECKNKNNNECKNKNNNECENNNNKNNNNNNEIKNNNKNNNEIKKKNNKNKNNNKFDKKNNKSSDNNDGNNGFNKNNKNNNKCNNKKIDNDNDIHKVSFYIVVLCSSGNIYTSNNNNNNNNKNNKIIRRQLNYQIEHKGEINVSISKVHSSSRLLCAIQADKSLMIYDIWTHCPIKYFSSPILHPPNWGLFIAKRNEGMLMGCGGERCEKKESCGCFGGGGDGYSCGGGDNSCGGDDDSSCSDSKKVEFYVLLMKTKMETKQNPEANRSLGNHNKEVEIQNDGCCNALGYGGDNDDKKSENTKNVGIKDTENDDNGNTCCVVNDDGDGCCCVNDTSHLQHIHFLDNQWRFVALTESESTKDHEDDDDDEDGGDDSDEEKTFREGACVVERAERRVRRELELIDEWMKRREMYSRHLKL